MNDYKLPYGFTSNKIKANGIEQHFLMGGAGEPLVLLHGFPQTSYEWFHIMVPLAEKYTVIVPDLRGAGLSEKPVSEDGYTKTVLANDLRELLRTLNIEKTHIAGHDIGGMVAYTFGVLYPKMLGKLILMDMAIVGHEPYWSNLNTSYDLWHFGFFQKPLALKVFTGNEETLVTSFTEELTYNVSTIDRKSLEIYSNYLKTKNGLEGQFNYYKSFPKDAEENAVYTSKKLNIPTLIIAGAVSMGNGNLMFTIFENLIVSEVLESYIVEKSGHWVVEEQRDAVLQEMLRFLI
ncbi:alpha/beta hydrolase [uncultured Croceitalea sp.]|uniref:alpha/beta fold hydrolase n=1 Tax=uncultured Croceitalea sp. TaxID=1798908 RepID=UPI0033061D07